MSLSLPPSDATRGEVELTLTGASFGYRPEKVLLHDLTLSARAGDFISICGENGAGKSTLLKGLLGLLAPLSGVRQVHSALNDAGIGYVAQTSSLPPDMPGTVLEVLRTGLPWHFFSRNKAPAGLLENVLSHFDCARLAAQPFRQLSGGQMKRVLIARAVLASRRFIVLDEPCAGLDTQNTERIMDALYDLNQTQGTTILQVTHDKVAALRYSSHVWHVADGAVHDESLEEHLGEARG